MPFILFVHSFNFSCTLNCCCYITKLPPQRGVCDGDVLRCVCLFVRLLPMHTMHDWPSSAMSGWNAAVLVRQVPNIPVRTYWIGHSSRSSLLLPHCRLGMAFLTNCYVKHNVDVHTLHHVKWTVTHWLCRLPSQVWSDQVAMMKLDSVIEAATYCDSCQVSCCIFKSLLCANPPQHSSSTASLAFLVILPHGSCSDICFATQTYSPLQTHFYNSVTVSSLCFL